VIAAEDMLITQKNEYGDYKVTKLSIKQLEVKENQVDLNKSVRVAQEQFVIYV
jgi:hypothetical protein